MEKENSSYKLEVYELFILLMKKKPLQTKLSGNFIEITYFNNAIALL